MLSKLISMQIIYSFDFSCRGLLENRTTALPEIKMHNEAISFCLIVFSRGISRLKRLPKKSVEFPKLVINKI